MRRPDQGRQARSVAGGGDTVAALNAAGVAEQFTYVSTAGGAFLEWMEGKALARRRGFEAKIDADGDSGGIADRMIDQGERE